MTQYLGALPPNTMIAHLLLLFPGIWQNLSYLLLYVRYTENWLRSRSQDKASLVLVVCYVSCLVGNTMKADFIFKQIREKIFGYRSPIYQRSTCSQDPSTLAALNKETRM
ncbi:hypothetical protein [Brasilonema sennae]|uniref:hypothetical protein n=1 Tax=Brasilonema sennae TaxID=1397703 RepID=UPI00155A4B21|nr:hypothetical protein [Brasilonema sennae]